MPLFKHRPLAFLCVLFLFGIGLSVITGGAATVFVGALSVFLFFLPALYRRFVRPVLAARHKIFLYAVAFVLLLSQIFSVFSYLYPPRALPLDAGEVTLEGRVEEVLFSERYAAEYYVALSKVDEKSASGRILLSAEFAGIAERGDRVCVRATLHPLNGKDDIYRKADGCIAVAEAVSPPTVFGNAPTLGERIGDALHALRDSLSNRLTDHVPGEGGRLMSAMLLGDRDALSDTTVRDFRRLGISHILAISGLHLQILIFLFSTALSRVGVRRTPATVLLSAFVIFYMALTGFSPSVVRAGVMALFLSLSFLVREQTDSITSLSLVAVLMILFSPATIYDVGFLLSCFATLGILIASELRQKRENVKRPFARQILTRTGEALLITLSAVLATLPITALFFGEISLLSLPANLLLTPLFSLYLVIAPIVLLLAPIPFIGTLCSLLGGWLLAPVSALASLPHTLIDIAYPDVTAVAISGAVLFFFFLSTAKRRHTLAVAGGCILSLLLLSVSMHSVFLSAQTEVRYVEKAKDEYLLLLEGGKGFAYDATGGTSRTRDELLSLLDEAHLCELEGYVLSHYHARHPDALSRLLGKIRIGTLYLPAPSSPSEQDLYDEIAEIASAAGTKLTRYAPRDEIAVGGATLVPFSYPDTEHPTLALSIRRNGKMLTYVVRDEKGLAAPAVAQSDFLILGTHGPKGEELPYTQYKDGVREIVALRAQECLHPAMLLRLRELGVLREENVLYILSLD